MEWIRGPVIGRGSSSVVSLSFSPASGEVLAVKSVELSNSSSLRKETGCLSRLKYPHVVEYRGWNITNEGGRPTYNLFMEYVPRGTLRDLIHARGGRLKEPEVREIAGGILLGLEYIHKKGVAHCDIKTQNILITDQGPKIADFGCAKLVEEDRAAAFAGTPAYMSPEVARREEQGYAADVWSFGCTVLEMATGSLPWMDADCPVLALYRIGYSGEVPDPPQWLTEEVRDFVRRCLIRDPKERPSVKELLRHPFLWQCSGQGEAVESSRVNDTVDGDSPNGVLELRLWESMESSDAEITWPDVTSGRAGERMEDLIMGCDEYPMSGHTEWGTEDGWIIVRSRQDEEVEDGRDENSDLPENVLLVSQGELDLGVFSLHDYVISVSDDINIIKEITVTMRDSQDDCLVFKESRFEEDDPILNQLKIYRVLTIYGKITTVELSIASFSQKKKKSKKKEKDELHQLIRLFLFRRGVRELVCKSTQNNKLLCFSKKYLHSQIYSNTSETLCNCTLLDINKHTEVFFGDVVC